MAQQRIGSGQELDLDEFLGHSTRGQLTPYLENWHKKREPPEVHVVLHTRCKILSVWSHPWPRVVEREKDGVKSTEVWSGRFNSWETEALLTKQYLRDDDGRRKEPPTICPMSLMLERAYELWLSGDLKWDQVLFRFVGDDPTKAKELHVAGMLGLTKKVWSSLSEADIRKALRAGVPPPKEAWKEVMWAKCGYIFVVVDYDNPDDGLQIAQETTLVGDLMKKKIRDRRLREGPEKGHPLINPCVFKWSFHEKAKEFNEKYRVTDIGEGVMPITDKIRALIVDKDPPDVSHLLKRGNIDDLRSSMEEHYVGPPGLFDWDLIFVAAERINQQEEGEEEAEDDGTTAEDIADEITGEPDEDEDEQPEEQPKAAAKPATQATKAAQPAAAKEPEPAAAGRRVRRQAKPAEPPPDPRYVVAEEFEEDGETIQLAADGVELIACDKEGCGVIMRADEDTCRGCGTQYELLQPEPEKPAQASKAAPGKAAAAGAGAAKAAPKGGAQARAKEGGKDGLGF